MVASFCCSPVSVSSNEIGGMRFEIGARIRVDVTDG